MGDGLAPRVLRAGDDILLGGQLHTVQAVSATAVRLVNVVGMVSAVPLADVLASPGFALVSSARARAPLPPSGRLDGIPETEAEQARWWERHIAEVITGLPPEHAGSSTQGRVRPWQGLAPAARARESR